MKKMNHILLFIGVGAFFLSSCSSLGEMSSYYDDIYYNPNSDETVAMDKVPAPGPKIIEEGDNTDLPDEAYLGEEKTSYMGNYDEYEYTDRLQKFHNDEYQGGYYEDDQRDLSMSFNFGYSPYGSYWGTGFNYGYPYHSYVGGWYDPWYSPYHYSPFLYSYWDPFYSWHLPWYRHYGYHYYPYSYYPYYYDNYYSHYNYRDDEDFNYNYGHRRSSSTGSSNAGVAVGGGTRASQGTSNGAPVGGTRVANDEEPSVRARASQSGESKKSVDNTNVTRTRSSSNPSVQNSNVERRTRTNVSNASESGQESVVRTRYTRTRSSGVNNQNSRTRSGYTPSYTRPNSSTNRYNQGTTRTPQRYSTSGTCRTRSSGYSNTRSRSSSGSSYSAPTRTRSSSGSSYSAPRRSSSSSSSSYSAPRRSSSSSSSSSGSSSGSSSSSSSSHRRR